MLRGMLSICSWHAKYISWWFARILLFVFFCFVEWLVLILSFFFLAFLLMVNGSGLRQVLMDGGGDLEPESGG